MAASRAAPSFHGAGFVVATAFLALRTTNSHGEQAEPQPVRPAREPTVLP